MVSSRTRASSDRLNVMLVVVAAMFLVSLVAGDDAYLWALCVGLPTVSLVTYQEVRDRRSAKTPQPPN